MGNKNKIMLISPKDNNFYNFRSELILKLHDIGNEIVLVCPYGKKIDYFTDRGCRFVDLAIDRRGANVLNDFKLMMEYRKLIKKEKPEIVLTYTTKPSVYAGLVCRRLKVPYIINNAGLMEASWVVGKIIDFLTVIGFKKASCVMYQNEYEMMHDNKLLHNKVHYRRIPGSGVNLNAFRFEEYPPSDKEIYFNYVALIKQIKGIGEYLECAKRIKQKYPNTHFRIYGGYDSTEYNEKIEQYQRQGIVEYQGVKFDMKPEIESCHAVIHPSYYEGMTNVVLEHSASGRVCIGSDIPGVKEGIEDGVTGLLFKVKNVDSMVMAVEKFIKLPYTEKKKMGMNARKKMEKEFDRNIVTNAYLGEISAILGEG